MREAVWAVDEEETVAVNDALAELAGIVIEGGTETTLSLLARLTTKPPAGAAALSETVQESVPAPVIEELAHETALSTGTPVPLRAIVDELPEEALLLMVNWPETAPEAVGAKRIFRVAL